MILRNMAGFLRSRYSTFFAWFGKISIELFISQVGNLFTFMLFKKFKYCQKLNSGDRKSCTQKWINPVIYKSFFVFSTIFGWVQTPTVYWSWSLTTLCSTSSSPPSSSSQPATRFILSLYNSLHTLFLQVP